MKFFRPILSTLLALLFVLQIPATPAAADDTPWGNRHKIKYFEFYKAYIYDDHDDWPKGDGEWYFRLEADSEIVNWRKDSDEYKIDGSGSAKPKLTWTTSTYLTFPTKFTMSAREQDVIDIWGNTGWDSGATAKYKFTIDPATWGDKYTPNKVYSYDKRDNDTRFYFEFEISNAAPETEEIRYVNLSSASDGRKAAVGDQIAFSVTATDADYDQLTYHWDLGDGTYSGSRTAQHNYDQAGEYQVALYIEDCFGAKSETVYYDITVYNQPFADAGGPYSVFEGTPLTLYGSSSSGLDNGYDYPCLYQWDLDGDGNFDDASDPIVSFPWWEDDFEQTVGLEVRREDSWQTYEDYTTVTVLNVAPAVSLSGGATINEGDIFTGAGTFTDPGTDSWTATADYGDGSGEFPVSLNTDKTFSLERPYPDDGIFTIMVAITDDDGGTGIAGTDVTVLNVAPEVNAGGDRNGLSGDTCEVYALFTDPGLADSHHATIIWGDGTTSEPDASSGTVNDSHVYLAPGEYTVTVTVTDDDGGTGSDCFIYSVSARPASMEIKPGDGLNPINLTSKGKIPVAIMGGDCDGYFLDVTTINPSTVVFAGAPTLDMNGSPEDVNEDGTADFVYHFDTQQLELTEESTIACLTFQNSNGIYFEAYGEVTIRPSKNKK